MKTLSARSVAEIREIFDKFEIDFPDSGGQRPTKKELLSELERLGIDNKTIKTWEEKEDQADEIELKEDNVHNDVVVQMNRNNRLFAWRGYKFTADKKFLPMPKSDALELIQAYDGFKIATREEIARYYK